MKNCIEEYESIFSVDKWGNSKVYQNLKNKILKISKEDNCHKYLYDGGYNNKSSLVKLSRIRGHVSNTDDFVKDDFYSLLSSKDGVVDSVSESKALSSNKENWKSLIMFDSKDEANNFVKYCKSQFVMFCLSIYKMNQNNHRGELRIIPWLDFSQEWNNEEIYKHFNITQDEINFIENNIPDYYNTSI